MNEFPNFSFDTSAVISDNTVIPSEQWKLLRRLKIPSKFNHSHGQPVKRGLALDVEATGLSLENDDVIQLAMLPFRLIDWFVLPGVLATEEEKQRAGTMGSERLVRAPVANTS